MLAFGMVAALMSARATGRGQVVDCAMTEGSAVLMAMIYSLRSQGLWRDERGVNPLDSGSHYYDTYETADGKFVSTDRSSRTSIRSCSIDLGLRTTRSSSARTISLAGRS